ncbi:MAG: hypothetical protein E6I81_09960 [Chloroflexi bacterium]|nr:MAG: hypothetical protein AUI15_05755 [Actinobacteria bacterium 13_2_20CM_2_66_6]TMD42049.1 MAG: hypothetical protein E6I89_00155 [Chloroflexota bacterium]TMD71687.1 MAG: hypothetical protein E6I81_09960 [Chloroflexota bacterium]
MKARSVVVGALMAGAMSFAGGGGASANMAWCVTDPPIQVVTPGGHNLLVNNQVYLPPYAMHLKNQITDDAKAEPDGKGGTLITVYVHVPAHSHIVSSDNRYRIMSQQDGSSLVTLYLDVPIS